MKILLVVILNFLFFCDALLAQDKILIAEGATPDLYITHTVSPKENFYSIGRSYNVSPKEIAPYNNLALENGLSLGQIIKIPLNQNNFLQSGAASQNTMTPVYHIVEPKEGLYHVSTTYNKVPTDLLKKWNNLQSDVVSNGTNLIVGYLNVKNGQSPLPIKAADNIVTTTEEVKKPTSKTDLPKEKEQTVKSTKAENSTNATTKIDNQPIKEKVKPKTEEVVFNKRAIDFKGGAFKTLYDNQIQKRSETTESGLAGVFKSTSGWQDGKYYCFHNSAAPGTIMKITSYSTGKSIYAKVLDLMPDIKQNEGFILHISNSAAEELSVGENKFDCSISYAK